MTDKSEQASVSSAFISYSRKNIDFVRKLNDGLDASGIKAWVDWEGIPPSSDWMEEITRAIQAADALVFVITPDSLASKVCRDELELGLKYNKKLIPVLHIEPAKETEMHEKLAATNWIYMREKDDFTAAIPKVVDAINTDLDWVQQHTRILQRATEWETKKRNASFLIQGAELEEAQHWLTQSTAKPNRVVIPLQAEYINASRKGAAQRQRNLLVGVSLALVVSIALGIVALYQSNVAKTKKIEADNSARTAVANANLAATNEHIAATAQSVAQANEATAIKNETTAKSQRSAAQAQIYQSQPGGLDISTLLAIDSWQREPSNQTEDILRQNLSYLPVPVISPNNMPYLIQNGEVTDIQFTPDGERFVIASADKRACVWMLATAEKLFCVYHNGVVIDAQFTDNGQTLVTASEDGNVSLWDSSTGNLKKQFLFNVGINDIDITPDGDWIAVAEKGEYLSIIRPSAGMIVLTLSVPSEPETLAFDPEGKWLAIGMKKGNVMLWRLMSEVWITFPSHAAEVYQVKFSPNGKWVVSIGADNTARLSLAANGEQKFVMLHGDWVENVAFSPDSSWFVTGSDDNNAWAWSTANGQERFRMKNQGFVQQVRVSSNGQWIATSSNDKTVRIWDAASGVEMQEISLMAKGTSLAFSPDGTRLITSDINGNIMIWDVSALSERIGYVEFPQLAHEAHFSPSGEWLAVNTDDRRVWLFGMDTLINTHSYTSATSIFLADKLTYDMDVSPDSRWIAVREDDSRVLLYDMKHLKQTILDNSTNVSGIGFSADSQQLGVAGNDGSVDIWDINAGKVMYTISNDTAVYSVHFSMDGKWLALGSAGHTNIWDLVQQKQIGTLSQNGNIIALKFSPDGKWLVTASSEGAAILWAIKDGPIFQEKHTILQNVYPIALDINPDSSLLAIGSSDKFMYLLNLATGEEIARIPHSNAVSGISFSKDGSLLTSVANKTVQIWQVSSIVPIPTADIVNIACSRMTSNLDEATWAVLFNGEPYQAICPTQLK
jgi:WD40 repeat protein